MQVHTDALLEPARVIHTRSSTMYTFLEELGQSSSSIQESTNNLVASVIRKFLMKHLAVEKASTNKIELNIALFRAGSAREYSRLSLRLMKLVLFESPGSSHIEGRVNYSAG